MNLASRFIFQQKGRSIFSIVGVSLAISLILLLNGLLAGTRSQVTSYMDHSPGSLVVMQSGSNSMLSASSLLPEDIMTTIGQTAGVTKAIPVLSQTAFIDLQTKKVFTYLIGYDPALGGGPWKLSAGREPQENREIVIDQALARNHNIALGDEIEVAGFLFPVVGFSAETNNWMTTIVFLRKASLESFLSVSDRASFLLLDVDPRVSIQELQSRLSKLPGVEVWLKSDINLNDLRFSKAILDPMQFMNIVAFFTGVLIIGLMAYTSLLDYRYEYGVLKAIGVNTRYLSTVILKQNTYLGFAGALLGLAVAWFAAQLIMAWWTQFLIVFEPLPVVIAFMVGPAMALFASLVPIYELRRLDPMLVLGK